MTISTSTTALGGWRLAAIGAVGALAVGAGVVAGSFLLTSRAVALGAGAAYVPADAPFYVELSVVPSAEQDAALRELLGHFPAIEGIDLSQPLGEQLAAFVDEQLAAEGVEVSWTSDVAPWFDGHVAFAVTEVALEATVESQAAPPAVVLLGVTDAASAEAALDRIWAAGDGPALTETEHAGVTVHVASGEEMGAYALTDDQLIVGSNEEAVASALETHANPSTSLATTNDMARMAAALPSDWLAFATWDLTDMVAQALEAAAAEDAAATEAMRGLIEAQPLRGALAVSAAGDRIALDTASEPSSAYPTANADRGLAAEVPGDAFYYSEAGNVGDALAWLIGGVKEAAVASGEGGESIAMAEAALGGELEELVTWIGDAAMVAGTSGDVPYAGVVINPTDMAEAERRIDQLATFASLGGMDPSMGISVDSETVDGVTVTTFRWEATGVEAFAAEAGPVVVQVAMTDDRVLIGVGDAFVTMALGVTEGTSLAAQARYTDAVAELGGPDSAGITWVDVAGLHEVASTLAGPMLPAETSDWLGPIDRFVSVTVLEGGLLVQHAALLVD